MYLAGWYECDLGGAATQIHDRDGLGGVIQGSHVVIEREPAVQTCKKKTTTTTKRLKSTG